jgi:hypothetical protein
MKHILFFFIIFIFSHTTWCMESNNPTPQEKKVSPADYYPAYHFNLLTSTISDEDKDLDKTKLFLERSEKFLLLMEKRADEHEKKLATQHNFDK